MHADRQADRQADFRNNLVDDLFLKHKVSTTVEAVGIVNNPIKFPTEKPTAPVLL